MRKILCLALLSALVACAAPAPPRPPLPASPGAVPAGATRTLYDNQGRQIPCTVYGGGLCFQR